MAHMQSSFMSKLPEIMVMIGERKAELAGKKQELLEAKRLGGDAESTKHLEIEWGFLESDINLLEHAANVMKLSLAKLLMSEMLVIMATIGERKEELAGKKQELLEAMSLGEDSELTKQLAYDWGFLESEINLLEYAANVKKAGLLQRGLLLDGKV
ncbi:hypothetical protein LXL04_001529 [Taraxacum kok-saghyz]